MTTFRPARVGDILHIQGRGGAIDSALIGTVADDGRSITITAPAEPHDLIVVIRRVDRFLQPQEI